eukprot:1054504-Prorocentrum_lima.AAC.1
MSSGCDPWAYFGFGGVSLIFFSGAVWQSSHAKFLRTVGSSTSWRERATIYAPFAWYCAFRAVT